ncbi:MAG: LamG domain-containing protein [Chthoniobacteraceae bacterium]
MKLLPFSFSRHFIRCGCTAMAFAYGTLAHAESPFYENRLNDESGLELKNGAAIGPAGSGVSGKPDDKAYVANASSVPDGQPGPVAVIKNGALTPFTSDEVTVTLWYKPNSEFKDATSILNAFCGLLIWSAKEDQWNMRLDAANSTPESKFATWMLAGKNDTWKATGQWTFVAFVWKADHTWEYYLGTSTQPATSFHKGKRDSVGPITERAPKARTLGNTNNSKADRALDGSLDDVRVYSKALSASDLEKIRKADLDNDAPSL